MMLLTDQFYLNQYARPHSLDEHWMRVAIQQAYFGRGFTKPNPMVGAVLINKQGFVIGLGYHTKFGQAHAEVETIQQAVKKQHSLEDCTLYCTLEPCCHNNKKTPPCLPLILEKKIKRIVIGTLDPNPAVCGKSVDALKQQGVEVTVGILENACRFLIKEFITKTLTNLPYVHLKIAQSLDGSHGTTEGDSSQDRWMTNEMAKNYVHELRANTHGVVIGGNTLRSDKPQLNCRIHPFYDSPDFRQPDKIILTKNKNIEHQQLKKQIDYNYYSTLEELSSSHYQSLLIEAGPKLMSSFIEKKFYNEISIIVTPKILGNIQKLKFMQDYNLKEAVDLNSGQWFKMQDNYLFHWVKPILKETTCLQE